MPEKYKDEIEEILRQVGEVVPSDSPEEQEKAPEDRPTRLRRGSPSRSPGPPRPLRWPSVSPGKLMLAGLIAFLVGLIFWPLIWVGLGMFVVAYLLYFVSPRSISYEKRWRGRPIEESRSTWQRFRRWLGS